MPYDPTVPAEGNLVRTASGDLVAMKENFVTLDPVATSGLHGLISGGTPASGSVPFLSASGTDQDFEYRLLEADVLDDVAASGLHALISGGTPASGSVPFLSASGTDQDFEYKFLDLDALSGVDTAGASSGQALTFDGGGQWSPGERVLVSSGSAADPGHAFLGISGAGLFSTEEKLGLAMSGATGLRVDADGVVETLSGLAVSGTLLTRSDAIGASVLSIAKADNLDNGITISDSFIRGVLAGSAISTISTNGVTLPRAHVFTSDRASPGFAGNADKDTGIHLPDDDTIEFVTSGEARAIVTNDGMTIDGDLTVSGTVIDSTGLIESMPGHILDLGPADQIFTLDEFAPMDYTILSLTARVQVGNVDVTLEVDGTPVSGINNVNIDTTQQQFIATDANVVASGSRFVMLVSGGGGGKEDLGWTVAIQRIV